MRKLIFSGIVIASLSAAPARADVELTIHDGVVSLTAHDATLKEILAEWARVGQTKIVNGDRAPGGPLSLQFSDVPEAQALEIILRSVSGYLAAPRSTYLQNASRFDRIVVMPTAVSARAATQSPSGQAASPRPPIAAPPPPANNQVEDDSVPNVPSPPPGGRPPVFTTFPAPDVVLPPQGNGPVAAPPAAAPTPTNTTIPTAPPGVAVPGVIIQPPPAAAPGQGGAPQGQGAP